MKPSEVKRALIATCSVLSELGLDVDDAIVLQNANRLAVHLVPCDVLARVRGMVGRDRHAIARAAAFELEMALGLANTDSPIGVLEPRVEPLVHQRDGFAMTYWEYYEPLPDDRVAPVQYAAALERLHAGMRAAAVRAPPFTDRVDAAQTVVDDRTRSPELLDTDREFLATTLQTFRHAITARGGEVQLLHGEPHDGNLLPTSSGLRFVDLETCCYGPVEFDVAHIPAETAHHYAAADRSLVRDCRVLALSMVAAWRFDRNDRYPGRHQARTRLLSVIRKAVDRHHIDAATRQP